jgi:hypothetical protein
MSLLFRFGSKGAGQRSFMLGVQIRHQINFTANWICLDGVKRFAEIEFRVSELPAKVHGRRRIG